jgi:preprotein translocase subunit SecY
VLSNLKNIFKVADLRNKILFTLAMVAIYRFGVAIRVPGIDNDAVKQFQEAVETQGTLGFLNLLCTLLCLYSLRQLRLQQS